MRAIDILNYSADKEKPRHKHLISAFNIARYVLDDYCIDYKVKEKILNTVMLHDIGYSRVINKTGFHWYDGYMFLKENATDLCFHNAILLHSDVINTYEGKYIEEVKKVYDNLTELEHIALIILDYCDVHSDGNGKWVNVKERYEEALKRYGDDVQSIELLEKSEEYSYNVNVLLPYALRRLEKLHGDYKSLI